MDQLHEEFYRSHPELFSQSGNRSGRRIAGAPPDDQEFRREFIRFLWAILKRFPTLMACLSFRI